MAARPSSQTRTEIETEWADPGFFAQQSPVRNFGRIIRQLILRPTGHKTIPTRIGFVLILLIIGISSGAYNTANNILFIAVAVLLSALTLGGILSWCNMKGLRWRLIAPGHLRAGEPAPVSIEVRNEKRWMPTYSVWFQLEAQRSGETARLPLSSRLDPGQSATLDWPCTPRRRGIEVMAIKQVRSTFPFGFLRKTIDLDQKREIIVWASRIDYEISRARGVQVMRDGAVRLRLGGGTELMNVREYRTGDPPRVIHWKASARQRRLMVREMEQENRTTFTICLDTSTALWRDDEQFETLCSLAGSLAEDLYRTGELHAVAVNGGPIQEIRRLSDLHAFLDQLAAVAPESDPTVTSRLHGPSIIQFAPGSRSKVRIIIGGNTVGTA